MYWGIGFSVNWDNMNTMTEGKKLILIVDDDQRLTSIIQAYLEKEGFLVEISGNGREALDAAKQLGPDLIILDIMMPEMNGYQFLDTYRKISQTPVILLSARESEEDQIKGFELGADDYVIKPFHPRTLVARVQAILRRTVKIPTHESIDQLVIGDILLDHKKHLVYVNQEVTELTPTEFILLATMMASPGKVFTRLDLLEEIQGSRYVGYERTIDIHIKNLRSKIEKNPHHPKFIETIYGVGYRFMEPS